MSHEDVLEAALALRPDERIALSIWLLESVDPDDDAVDGLWFAEGAWRHHDPDRGEGANDDEAFAEYDEGLDP